MQDAQVCTHDSRTCLSRRDHCLQRHRTSASLPSRRRHTLLSHIRRHGSRARQSTGSGHTSGEMSGSGPAGSAVCGACARLSGARPCAAIAPARKMSSPAVDGNTGADELRPVPQINIAFRDHCAHKLVDLNECRRENYYLPWTCQHEKHSYEKCQYKECVDIMAPDIPRLHCSSASRPPPSAPQMYHGPRYPLPPLPLAPPAPCP